MSLIYIMDPVQYWSKATREQRKTRAMGEVTRMEQECYSIEAELKGQQGV